MDIRPFDILLPKTLLQERYRVVRLIGRGGMGAVYEATDIRLKISVALKQTMVGGAQFRKAFQHEALLLARLRHAALPVVTDYFIEDDARPESVISTISLTCLNAYLSLSLAVPHTDC